MGEAVCVGRLSAELVASGGGVVVEDGKRFSRDDQSALSMSGRSMSPSFWRTSVLSDCKTSNPTQVAHAEQEDEVDDEDEEESWVEVGVVLGSSSLLTVCASPFESMVRVGKPGGGGTIPPGITPAAGITMIPTPGPTYQIGRTVGCPSADVDVTEFAVKPSISAVVVANDPVSTPVCGPKVIVGLEVIVGAGVIDDNVTPPSSFGPKPFSGYAEFVML